jgi:DNA repair protein RadC
MSINTFFGKGHRENLRTRFMRSGCSAFADHEILELLLTYVIPRKDVKPIAKQLIHHFKNIPAIFDGDYDALQVAEGMGKKSAAFFQIVHIAMERYLSQERMDDFGIQLHCLQKLCNFWHCHLHSEQLNVYEIAYMSNSTTLTCDCIERLMGKNFKCLKSMTRSIVKHASHHHCSAIVICHHYPREEDILWESDVQMQKMLESTLRDLSITLLEYFIFCQEKIFSLKHRKNWNSICKKCNTSHDEFSSIIADTTQ